MFYDVPIRKFSDLIRSKAWQKSSWVSILAISGLERVIRSCFLYEITGKGVTEVNKTSVGKFFLAIFLGLLMPFIVLTTLMVKPASA